MLSSSLNPSCTTQFEELGDDAEDRTNLSLACRGIGFRLIDDTFSSALAAFAWYFSRRRHIRSLLPVALYVRGGKVIFLDSPGLPEAIVQVASLGCGSGFYLTTLASEDATGLEPSTFEQSFGEEVQCGPVTQWLYCPDVARKDSAPYVAPFCGSVRETVCKILVLLRRWPQ